MIEVIFGLIALTVLIYSISKLIKRRKRLNQDLLLEDLDMIHYGPFSGQYSIRRYVLTLLLCSSQVVFAGIDLRTIDNWGIDSWGSDALMLQKTSDSTKSNLYIEMSRPFCICTDPVITTPIGKSNFNEGDKIEATMAIDNYKPVDIVFYVDSILEENEYILKPRYYPSLRYAELIKIKFENDTPLQDISFHTKGMTNAMKQSEKICLSIYQLEESEMKDARNI